MKRTNTPKRLFWSCLLGLLLYSIPTYTQSYRFNNSNTSAPPHEACVGDQIIVIYDNLVNHPQFIRYNVKDSSGTTQSLYVNITPSAGNASAGSFAVTIPSDMGSGVWSLRDGSGTLLLTTQNILVHNPTVYFTVPNNPICATEQILLTGHPSGGVMTMVDPNLSSVLRNYRGTSRLNGTHPVLWDTVNSVTVHSGATEVGIQYSYTPTYTDSSLCPAAIDKIDTIKIRDNRLWWLRFKPVVRSPGGNNANIRLRVDSNTLIATHPNILDSAFTYYPRFSGTYVNNRNEFLVNQADAWNQVTMRYYNGGCVGEASGSLVVKEEPNIDGLPDTLCKGSGYLYFSRAASLKAPYRYTIDTSIIRVGMRSSSRIYVREENWVDSVYIYNQPMASDSAIRVLNSTKGQESYQFRPNQLVNTGTITVVMVYKSSYEFYNNSIVDSNSYYYNEYISFLDTQQIVILSESQLPRIFVGAIDSTYCSYDGNDTLQPTPAYIGGPGNVFSFFGQDTSQRYAFNNSIRQDSVFEPRVIFDTFVPAGDRDLSVQIIYTAQIFGCSLHDTAYTTIIAPLELTSDKQGAYCIDEAPDTITIGLLLGGGLPSGGSGQFIQPSWMDSSVQNYYGGIFRPNLLGVGRDTLEYHFTDPFGCKHIYKDTLVVRNRPQFTLAFDNDTNKRTFCANVDSSNMTVSGVNSVIDAVAYTGPGITTPDSIFNPNGAYYGLDSIYNVIVTVRARSGCESMDTFRITIGEPPQVDLNVAFNNQSRTLPNGTVVAHSYCHDDDEFSVYVSPSHLDATATGWMFQGDGINVFSDSVSYDPSRNVSAIDTVYYTYTDSLGCSNTDTALIQIDTVPSVQLNDVASIYCTNQDTVQLTGIPNDSLGIANGSYFNGSGLDSLTGLFDPSQAGLGNRFLSYTFTSREGCVGTDVDTIFVNVPPRAEFGGIKANRQYCMLDPIDTLESLNAAVSNSSYSFWGAVVLDSTGIWQPDTSRGVNPDTAGNFQTIYYAYTAPSGCSDTTSIDIFVSPMPILALLGLDSAYCGNSTLETVVMSHNAYVDTTGAGYNGLFEWLGNRLTIYPSVADTGYTNFTLFYTDPAYGCSDTLSARIYVYDPIQPYFTAVGQSGFSTLHCAHSDVIPLEGTPAGGIFAGTGIVAIDTLGSYGFLPYGVGNGTHTISYSIQDTFQNNTLHAVCQVDTQVQVTVQPLPRADIQSPRDNSRFCSTDGLVALDPYPILNDSMHIFSNPYGRIAIQPQFLQVDTFWNGNRWITDTVFTYSYYFNPDSASSDSIFTDYQITHIAVNTYGCADTNVYNYSVNLYEPAYFAIDSVFCQGDLSVFLAGTPTSNGVFIQNGDTMRVDPNTGVITYYPVTDTLGGGRYAIAYDTVSYSYDNGFCSGQLSIPIRVDTAPIVGFMQIHNYRQSIFCVGDDPAILRPIPNQLGGVFSINDIPLLDTIFDPNVAGVGEHWVRYTFVEPATTCEGSYEDTFYVYGMPDVAYHTVGGCQSDSIRFIPTISGLDNFFQGRLMDQITSIQWILGPNNILTGTGLSNGTQVDSISYRYTAPGIYHTQLMVANQVHCVDTHEVRLVVSPTIHRDSFPYDQTFEHGDGNWFAESRDASHSLLWEWGVDNNPRGISANATNHIWATGLDSMYQTSEDAWVYSPCFDMSSLIRPMISLDYWSDTRNRVDGTLLEYQKDNGSWAPLGELNRGINWFNEGFIAGQPGEPHLPPIGWAGQNADWVNGRYKLDGYARTDNILRLRMAFGSSQIPTTNFYDGFAFDNVWIGDRTRNVLLETTSNIGQIGMTNINAHVYNLIFHTTLNKDVTMIQYHTESPDATDQFYRNMENIADLRAFDYGSDEAGRAYVDGSFIDFASALTSADFEVDMLQNPKFDIQINGGLQYIPSQQTFVLNATVKALEDMPALNYRIYTTITEDSLTYQNNISYPDEIHAVVRKDDDNANLMRRAWTAGDTMNVTLIWDHTNDSYINYRAGRFQGVVFIQAKESSYKEVFQVATTRDVTGYHIGVDPTLPQVQNEFQELQNMVLFPNPANDYFNVRFEAPLSTDYNWKLMDIRGVTVQTGRVTAGAEQFQIDELTYPSGTYVLVLYNQHVFGERKVVIQRP